MLRGGGGAEWLWGKVKSTYGKVYVQAKWLIRPELILDLIA